MGVESRAQAILAGNIVPFVAGTIFWLGRVYSRAVILRTWGKDDWLLVVGWVAALANCIMACVETQYGAGRHVDDIPQSDLIPSTKLSYGTLITYQAALCFTKLSLCTLYLRVFTTSRSGTILLYGILGFVIALNLAAECVSIFQCSPVQGVWDASIKPKCISTIPTFYVYAVANILLDAVLMAFALPKVLGLRMAPRQKYALIATIALGGVTIIAGIIRCVRVSQILTSSDPTWKSYDSSIWSSVDANVSVLCASAPVIKPLLRQIAPGLMGSTIGSSQPGQSGPGRSGRLTWLGTTRETEKGYELRSVPQHRDPRSISQTELTFRSAQSEWTAGRHGREVEEEDITSEGEVFGAENGIMKSTQ